VKEQPHSSLAAVVHSQPEEYAMATEWLYGIAALVVSVGLFIACAGVGVYFLTKAGKRGVEIAQLEEQRKLGSRS
jgi:hypothetical protein